MLLVVWLRLYMQLHVLLLQFLNAAPRARAIEAGAPRRNVAIVAAAVACARRRPASAAAGRCMDASIASELGPGRSVGIVGPDLGTFHPACWECSAPFRNDNTCHRIHVSRRRNGQTHRR